MNYLISGKALSGQPELFVVKLVSDIWAKKKRLPEELNEKTSTLCHDNKKNPNKPKHWEVFVCFVMNN